MKYPYAMQSEVQIVYVNFYGNLWDGVLVFYQLRHYRDKYRTLFHSKTNLPDYLYLVNQ